MPGQQLHQTPSQHSHDTHEAGKLQSWRRKVHISNRRTSSKHAAIGQQEP